ncbi:MAG: hypothetical protein U0Q07_14255 [Acidimicrobiales bacterium]
MATFFTVCEPADFAEWGGDDSGPGGAVYEEFVDEVERRRCERWDSRWLFTRDCSLVHVYGGVSRMTRAELDQLVTRGFLREVSADEFESAWGAAVASGTELADGHEDKPTLIRRAEE